MVLPNAIIAGVNKAGTTAVFHALARQDNVAVSDVKETHFFDPLQYGEPLPDIGRYQELFPAQTDAAAIVEGTPSYFYGGERLAEGIDAAVPGARVLVILREPGARAYSLWRFARSRLRVPDDLSFRGYLERCEDMGDEPQTKRELSGWRGLSGGMYSRYLPAWRNTFGSRLLVAFHDDIKADFEGAMERICAHFGVERIPDGQPIVEHNVTTDVSSSALQRLALAINNAGEGLWRRAPAVKAALRDTYYRINAKKVQQQGMSADDRRWLDAHFQDEIARLRDMTSDMTDRPAWLTGEPAPAQRRAASGPTATASPPG
jgi:hypothetical protein